MLSLFIILLAIVAVVFVAVWVNAQAGWPGPMGQIVLWIICGIALLALGYILLTVTGVDANIGGPLPRLGR